jgi:hypothetical protein
MRVDNEKELEMNKYEKMSYELIEQKKKVKLDFEKTYIISVIFFMILSVIFGMRRRNIELELVFTAILLGWLVSILLGFVSCFVVFAFLKISNFFILLKDREYQLAKEVMLNYEKKKDEETKRNKCIHIIYKEKEKHERIYGLERYLEDEKRKRKDFINEKNNNIDVSDDE